MKIALALFLLSGILLGHIGTVIVLNSYAESARLHDRMMRDYYKNAYSACDKHNKKMRIKYYGKIQ